ncbi:MAG: hypothetical protein OQK74_05810 [Gammaproteobacteria bacterium]|jgi:hypothetical protein|nr:hypothetical protein [Gammaproteobacteria bacterium]
MINLGLVYLLPRSMARQMSLVGDHRVLVMDLSDVPQQRVEKRMSMRNGAQVTE